MPHLSLVFPEDVADDMVVAPMHKTTVGESASGYEQRNQEWALPRLKFQARHLQASRTQRDEIIGILRAARGRYASFNFKDHTDWFAGGAINGTTGAFVPSAPGVVFGTGTGTATAFQLYKPYSMGGYSVNRTILSPKTSTVKIYKAGALVDAADYELSSAGLVTFDTAPALGASLTWTGEFYVPVRFLEDEQELEAMAADNGSMSFDLIEVRAL